MKKNLTAHKPSPTAGKSRKTPRRKARPVDETAEQAQLAALQKLCEQLQKKNEQLRRQIAALTAKESRPRKTAKRKEPDHGKLERYELLFRFSPLGLVLEDRHGNIIDANEAMAKILGYPRRALIGMNVRQFVREENLGGVEGHIHRILSGEVLRHEVSNIGKHGREIFLELHEVRVTLPNGEDGILTIAGDVTEYRKAVQALRDSEEVYRKLVENSPYCIHQIDLKGKLISMNQAGLSMLNLQTEEDIRGVKYLAFVSQKDRRRVAGLWKEAVQGTAREFEFVAVNGRVFHSSFVPLVDDQGRVKQLMGLTIDITERKRSEEILRESEQTYRTLVEQSADAIYVIQDERYLLVNKAWQKLFGYSREEALAPGFDFRCLVAPESFPVIDARARARRCGEKLPNVYEFKGLTRSGEIRQVEVRVADIVWKGRPAVQGVYRDVTEQRRAEEALRASEEKYRTLFEESKDVIFISTPKGRFLDINPAGVELFGYASREEMLKIDIETSLFKDAGQRRELLKSLREKGFVRDFESVLKRKDGSTVMVLETLSEVRNQEGEVVAYRGIIRDITERKMLEQQLLQMQKMEAIGTLAGGIAHDFNNILAAILGYTELTMDAITAGSQNYQNLQHIYQAAQRAKSLVYQILTFSHRTEQKKQAVSVHVIVKEALKLLRAILPSTIQIRQNINSRAGTVMADPTQLHQVMMNLCTNAYHAMMETGGVLEVRLQPVELDESAVEQISPTLRPGKHVQLTVRDSGHGMDTATLKRIFDPFFTTKSVGVGTGMGLSVVHGIVQAYGGAITVESTPGTGSCFTIYFPRVPEAPCAESEDIQKAPVGSERILYVDDEETLLQMGRQLLEQLGYAVTTCTRGSQALAIFRDHPHEFDLVITDQTMPEMTGLELARGMVSVRADIPIILMSGYSETVSQDKIAAAGIREYLMKPVRSFDLSKAIRKVIDAVKAEP